MYLKEFYPVELEEYKVLQKIDHEPDFNWWENHVIQRRDIIISKVKHFVVKNYVKRTMKFGIECPKSVQEAMSLDNNNGNTLWADAISKKMRYV